MKNNWCFFNIKRIKSYTECAVRAFGLDAMVYNLHARLYRELQTIQDGGVSYLIYYQRKETNNLYQNVLKYYII